MTARAAGRVVLVAAAWLLATDGARACQSCFGAEDSPLIDGARLGVYVLGGLTLCVQVAFAAFFLYLRRRSKIAADLELEQEWISIQRGEGRS